MGEIAKRVGAAAAAAIITASASMVAYYEGYVPQTYADPVGIPTICYGHTGPDVTPGRRESQAGCRELLQRDLAHAYAGVQLCIRAPLLDHEAAALTSFVFNAGTNALCSSTLARMANAGNPSSRWCPELDRWVYSTVAGVKVRLPGLVNRRAAERRMCEGKPWK